MYHSWLPSKIHCKDKCLSPCGKLCGKCAKLIANTIAKVLPHKVANIVDGASMRIVDYAVTPQTKSAPSVTKYVAIGALLGLVLAAAIIIIIDFLDDTVHNAEILRQDYPNIPILASIPDLDVPSKGGYYKK